MAEGALTELRRRVIDDPQLHHRLLCRADQGAFVTEVVSMAQDLGLQLSPGEVVAALRAERRRRFRSWV